jgi:Alpha/beta hydrolase domain
MLRFAAMCLLFGPALAHAAVTSVEVTERADLPVAGYERIAGKVHFAVDPKLPANAGITDIILAPRDAQGKVEFSSNFVELRPKDPARSNGTLLVDIPNRGRMVILRLLDGGTGAVDTAEGLGDQFLLQQGFTLVWVGWEADVPDAQGALKLDAPVLPGIQGLVRSEILVNQKATEASLADRGLTGYEVADQPSASMSVRDTPYGARKEIPREDWKFSADGLHVDYAAGFEPGKIYDVVYRAKAPTVSGLGFAAVRDYVSYLKHSGGPRRALAFGLSQSGRFLRGFVYEGFNADERGRRVFEGVWADIAGAGRAGFNQRFAQPSRSTDEFASSLYAEKLAPFTSTELLANSMQHGVTPRLFLTNGSREYWGAAASLTHTTPDGKMDAPIPGNARIYFLAGTQHVSGDGEKRATVQNRNNPMEWRWFLRAVLMDLNAWVSKGTPPPSSQVPSVAKGELVTVADLKFPKIPGVAVPTEAFVPHQLDFGTEFAERGIITQEPPTIGEAYTALVPQVDADGNETSGVRLPELRVPLATYTGWNLRDPSIGSPQALYSLIGSMIPFARTRAERDKSGDPRLSIEERYHDQAQYLSAIETAARQLVRERFLLSGDVPMVVAHARQEWQTLEGGASTVQ